MFGSAAVAGFVVVGIMYSHFGVCVQLYEGKVGH